MNHDLQTKTASLGASYTTFRYYLFLIPIATVLGTVMQTMAMMLSYEGGLGGCQNGDVMGTIAGWILFFISLILLAGCFALPRAFSQAFRAIPDCAGLPAFLAAMGGCAMIAFSALSFIDTNTGATDSIQLLRLLFSIPAGLYLIFTAMNRQQGKVLTALGFCPTLWLALSLMRLFFDRSSAINNPMKILLQLSLAAIMLSFMAETRIRVGKYGARFLVGISAVATVLGVSSSVSMMIYRLNGGYLLNSEIMMAVIELILSLYLAARLYSYRTLTLAEKDTIPDTKEKEAEASNTTAKE